MILIYILLCFIKYNIKLPVYLLYYIDVVYITLHCVVSCFCNVFAGTCRLLIVFDAKNERFRVLAATSLSQSCYLNAYSVSACCSYVIQMLAATIVLAYGHTRRVS